MTSAIKGSWRLCFSKAPGFSSSSDFGVFPLTSSFSKRCQLNSAPACYEVRLPSRAPELSTWELIWNIAGVHWIPVRDLWYLEDHLWTSGPDFTQSESPGQLAICLELPANSKLPKHAWRWSVYEACQGSLVLKDYAEEQKVVVQGMFKTELCSHWQKTGACPFGDHCQFAHGIKELRPVHRHNLYKTKVCKYVRAGGQCGYGHRCHFRHDLTGQEKFM